jgi:hypothetical protein
MSDHPEDAPGQAVPVDIRSAHEQHAITDLNAAALHFGVPLGTRLGGVPLPVVCLRP